MVALKATEIDRFLTRPPPEVSLVLIFGPDAGLVRERAQMLVERASGGTDDPFCLVKLEASDISSDPARLADEAFTVSLFGGRRVVWIRDGSGRDLSRAVDPLLKQSHEMALVVIEAGDLKKGTGLRRKFENDRRAIAIPCYSDGGRDIDRLIDEESRLAGLQVSREARQALHGLLGADRMASRGELRKLCLYAHGSGRIETADVEAVIGDASAFAADDLIDAVALGDISVLDHGLERLLASGARPDMIGGMALRHFTLLHRFRALFDHGTPADQIVDRASPPIFFRRRGAVARQIALWQRDDLDRAIVRLGDAVKMGRLSTGLTITIMSDVLLTLARVARRRAARH